MSTPSSPTVSSHNKAQARLVADVNLSLYRLERIQAELVDGGYSPDTVFSRRAAVLIERSSALLRRVREWDAIEIGTPALASDLGAAVDTLEGDLYASSETEPSGYELAVDRQLRAWRSRMNQLRVQQALGAMEIRDELAVLAERLDHTRGGALVELQTALDDSRDVVDDLRIRIEGVLVDVRKSVVRAVSALSAQDY